MYICVCTRTYTSEQRASLALTCQNTTLPLFFGVISQMKHIQFVCLNNTHVFGTLKYKCLCALEELETMI
jgi:hypothetical protein